MTAGSVPFTIWTEIKYGNNTCGLSASIIGWLPVRKTLPNTAMHSDAPTEWSFNFFTPKALPAVVTFAAILDVDGNDYRFNTLNSTPDLPGVIGEWNDKDRAPVGYWNHVKRPPRHYFCWDSIIDKKCMSPFDDPKSVLEQMLMPSKYKIIRDVLPGTTEYKLVWLQKEKWPSGYREVDLNLITASLRQS
ncbi:DUF2931 family protein [Klebsiella quasipneumoniae subsp. similipneumoniae]